MEQRKNARARRDLYALSFTCNLHCRFLLTTTSLYRKAVQLKEAETQEKRAKLRDAIASGKPLDPSIAKDKALRKDLQYDDSRDVEGGDAGMDMDDEYSVTSGVSDPRVSSSHPVSL